MDSTDDLITKMNGALLGDNSSMYQAKDLINTNVNAVASLNTDFKGAVGTINNSIGDISKLSGGGDLVTKVNQIANENPVINYPQYKAGDLIWSGNLLDGILKIPNLKPDLSNVPNGLNFTTKYSFYKFFLPTYTVDLTDSMNYFSNITFNDNVPDNLKATKAHLLAGISSINPIYVAKPAQIMDHGSPVIFYRETGDANGEPAYRLSYPGFNIQWDGDNKNFVYHVTDGKAILGWPVGGSSSHDIIINDNQEYRIHSYFNIYITEIRAF